MKDIFWLILLVGVAAGFPAAPSTAAWGSRTVRADPWVVRFGLEGQRRHGRFEFQVAMRLQGGGDDKPSLPEDEATLPTSGAGEGKFVERLKRSLARLMCMMPHREQDDRSSPSTSAASAESEEDEREHIRNAAVAVEAVWLSREAVALAAAARKANEASIAKAEAAQARTYKQAADNALAMLRKEHEEVMLKLELQRQQRQQQQGLEEQLDKLSLSGGPRDTDQPDARTRTDMRIAFGRSNKKNLREDRGEYHVKDVVMVPSLFCEEEDRHVYSALLKELRSAFPEGGPEAGMSHTKGNRDGVWATRHGDAHVIADDEEMGRKLMELCPSFAKVVDRMAEYFDMDVKATRLNWYRPGSQDWKPYHQDHSNCPQNITVAASFGASRDIGFLHVMTHSVMTLPQPNGSCYAFGRDVNIEWMHGVLPLRKGETRDTGRISIIAWGWVDMAEGNC